VLSRLVSRLPPNLIRRVGRLQFKLPVVGPLIGYAARKLIAREGVIRYGAGAGLRFDARGGFAGYLLGTSEPLEQEALVRLLKPGMVFYDIGANVGFYSVIAARIVGTGGHVYAFEPCAKFAVSVRRNAALNDFTNVEVIEAGVSDREGSAEFIPGPVVGPNGSVRRDEGGSVPLVTIDGLTLRPPDLVMIDVEGAEVGVLRGMMRTIREHRPAIMCEVHWLLTEFDEVRAEIEAHGYECRTLDGSPFPTSPKHYHALLLPTG
jgi:FkbM family methyltransferase